MLSLVLEFLVLLNPFALFLYLLPIMRDLDSQTFRMEIFLRLNGFFVGAIGVNMIKVGIENILK